MKELRILSLASPTEAVCHRDQHQTPLLSDVFLFAVGKHPKDVSVARPAVGPRQRRKRKEETGRAHWDPEAFLDRSVYESLRDEKALPSIPRLLDVDGLEEIL